ncbi:MAG: hypothetical protein HUK17_02135 [Bacteroidales bacterium]|nr:hypothetical protein [Bacteroidales bacterium]
MKKHLTKLILPLVAVVILLAGCGREVELTTTYFTVKPGDWQSNGTSYAYAECPFPELTENVIQGGAVMVYFIDQNGYDNQLPYLLPYYETLEDGSEGLFFENVRYDLKAGFITFIVQQNDNYVFLPTATMQFKVCVFQNR